MEFFWIAIFILPSRAINCNVENCIQCSSTSPSICLQCASSYYLSRTTCTLSESNPLDQVSNCDIQTEDSKCDKCQGNYHIYEGFCEADCYEGCSCFEPYICEEHFLSETSDKIIQALTQCPQGCISCGDSGYCYDCDSLYTLYSGQCFFCPNTFCEECYSTRYCNVCETRYYAYSGICLPCSLHCQQCEGKQSCNICDSDYKVKDGLCKKDDDDSDSPILPVGLLIFLEYLSIFLVCSPIAYIIHRRRRRRLNRLIAQQQGVILQPVVDDQGNPIPNQPNGYSPPTHSDVVMGSARVVQLDGRNMVMGQDECSFCGKSLTMEVETILLPCNHALHGYCVNDLIRSGQYRLCPICNMQFL